MTEIKYPNFRRIMEVCQLRIIENFDKKSNSWIDCSDSYFVKKIINELIDFNDTDHPRNKEHHLINIINFASMLYHNQSGFNN